MRAPHFGCHGGGELPLRVQLRRITESKAVDIPAELLNPILEASHDAYFRRDIMKHLRECLSEPTGKRWHRIYLGMLLVEKLMQKGSRSLVIELAHGHHFDLIQKVSLLEHFDSSIRAVANPWAQSMVRQKAGDLRVSLVPQLEQASTEELPHDAIFLPRDTWSTCSPASTVTGGSTTASSTQMSTGSPSPFGTSMFLGQSGATSFVPPMRRHTSSGSHTLVRSPEMDAQLSPSARLQADLSRIIESNMIDLPPEFFAFIVEAARDAEHRVVIARSVQGCLKEKSVKKWMRIFAGLCLVESIMQRGNILKFDEECERCGFNLVRQVWLLQEFDYRRDWRAQNLVRKKARAINDVLVQKLQGKDADDSSSSVKQENIGDAFESLRNWVEAGEGSNHSDDSSRPSSAQCSSDEADRSPTTRRASPSSQTAANLKDEPEAFFTPLPTPAMPKRLPRPAHLLSL